MKTLVVSSAIRRALDALADAERDFVPGRDPMSELEVHKIRLADAVRAAVTSQRQARLPARADRGIVFVRLTPHRRKVGA